MRKIIKIDEALCNGCGECISACAEGAIELHGGKARVVSDSFCDGLGACLAVCPQGALRIEEREAEQFDETAAKEHLKAAGPAGKAVLSQHPGPHECAIAVSPCTAPISMKREGGMKKMEKKGEPGENELCGWPIQMRLVRPWAPYLHEARLLVAGDCTAFAYPTIQEDFIRGRVVLVGCPKLDETGPFVEKLAEILRQNEIKDISVLHMTVPCCTQLLGLVTEAIRRSGKDVPVESRVVGVEGKLVAADER
jgi:NAD-dependent dihydropyrimidine dehydrogenase PreA subunit